MAPGFREKVPASILTGVRQLRPCELGHRSYASGEVREIRRDIARRYFLR